MGLTLNVFEISQEFTNILDYLFWFITIVQTTVIHTLDPSKSDFVSLFIQIS